MNPSPTVARAIELLRQAKSVVALTGAGISTPSGIPDYRSPDSGLWEQGDLMEMASIYAFRHNPEAFFNWIRPLATTIFNAQPNPAHEALASLEANGRLQAIITQNIDLLHTRAGSQTVYEVHGSLRRATCLSCHTEVDGLPLVKALIETGQLPCCPTCDHILKPNVILFGELLPALTMHLAQQVAKQCDVMLVAGSSLEVAPAGDLPLLAKRAGARLIIVNFGPTHMDREADLLFREDVAELLPQLAAAFV
ncbi:SIR2 family NAD-dependent protein deacylase [Candidatus Leptofilum sp.]|uniref:SIR2 family NAD-dependent protein deacylase n=1 Tax=Candidatus Leptofilum sp. TaxID=3241576 RepID=UPI003B59AF36